MLLRYNDLENNDLKLSLSLGNSVLCGGRHGDPLYWMRGENNMGPTCGRTAPRDQLARFDFTQSESQGFLVQALWAVVRRLRVTCSRCSGWNQELAVHEIALRTRAAD